MGKGFVLSISNSVRDYNGNVDFE